jgi:CheY-like chemotaxis protein
MAKIVLVDDSRLARTVAMASLRKLGHEVLEVEPVSLFDVLKVLREVRPDILLMDFLMPGCPGTSLVRSVSEDEALRGTKVVVLTALRDEEVESRMERMGVAAILHKPCEPMVLASAVQGLLAEA